VGVELIAVERDDRRGEVRELFREYLMFLDPLFQRDFGVVFDMQVVLEQNMEELDKFMPPQGRIFLAYGDGKLAGCVCLRRVSEGLAEIKRMYVRPEQRRKGIGRALVEAAIAEAREGGCTRLRLDTAPFLGESQRLYGGLGFVVTPPYADSEIPAEFHSRWIFMELHLDAGEGWG
jgi:GNAT superfamily N-acetyltransferase